MSALVSIRTAQPYRHQGELLHPKLAYGVPTDVAAGMEALGLAARVDEPADVELPLLTWDVVGSVGTVSPDPITQPGSIA